MGRFLTWIKSNLLFAAILGGAVTLSATNSGCGGLFDMSFSPRSASASQYTGSGQVTNTRAFSANANLATHVENSREWADMVASVPTPVQPFAVAMANFLDGYSQSLNQRLEAMSHEDQATRWDFILAQLGAFGAGVSGIFIKRRTTAKAAS